MDDRERKPDNRNNKKRNYQLYVILAIVAAVTVALITGLDSLVKKSIDEGAARDAVKAAKRLLKCERANVRGAALEVIVRAEGTRAMPYVLAALEKGDIQYRNAALRYIGDKADDAVYATIAADRKRLSDEAWADVIEWFGVRHAASQTGAVTEAVGSSNDAVALVNHGKIQLC